MKKIIFLFILSVLFFGCIDSPSSPATPEPTASPTPLPPLVSPTLSASPAELPPTPTSSPSPTPSPSPAVGAEASSVKRLLSDYDEIMSLANSGSSSSFSLAVEKARSMNDSELESILSSLAADPSRESNLRGYLDLVYYLDSSLSISCSSLAEISPSSPEKSSFLSSKQKLDPIKADVYGIMAAQSLEEASSKANSASDKAFSLNDEFLSDVLESLSSDISSGKDHRKDLVAFYSYSILLGNRDCSPLASSS